MFKFNKKKLTKRIKSVIRQDALASVAIVSIMINVFFFSGVLLFAATNQIDMQLYNASFDNLCRENYTANLEDEVSDAVDKAEAQALFEVTCHSGEFERYHTNAVEAYLNDTL